MVRLLAAHGADLNAVGHNGQRPLARTAGHLETAVTLMRLVSCLAAAVLRGSLLSGQHNNAVHSLGLRWALALLHSRQQQLHRLSRCVIFLCIKQPLHSFRRVPTPASPICLAKPRLTWQQATALMHAAC